MLIRTKKQLTRVRTFHLPTCFLDYRDDLKMVRDCGSNIWCESCKNKSLVPYLNKLREVFKWA